MHEVDRHYQCNLMNDRGGREAVVVGYVIGVAEVIVRGVDMLLVNMTNINQLLDSVTQIVHFFW